MNLEALTPNTRVSGIMPDQAVTGISAQWHGSDAMTLFYHGIQAGRIVTLGLNGSGLLVKPELARAQLDVEACDAQPLPAVGPAHPSRTEATGVEEAITWHCRPDADYLKQTVAKNCTTRPQDRPDAGEGAAQLCSKRFDAGQPFPPAH
jgi:hypothetical protein